MCSVTWPVIAVQRRPVILPPLRGRLIHRELSGMSSPQVWDMQVEELSHRHVSGLGACACGLVVLAMLVGGLV